MFWGILGTALAIGAGALWWFKFKGGGGDSTAGGTTDAGPDAADQAVLVDAATRALKNERYAEAAAMFRRAGRLEDAKEALKLAGELGQAALLARGMGQTTDAKALEAALPTPKPVRVPTAPPAVDDVDREAARIEAKRIYAAGDATTAVALLQRVGDNVTLAKVLATEGRRDEAKRTLAALTPSAFRFLRTQELLAQLHSEDGDYTAAIETLTALVSFASGQAVTDPRVGTWRRRLAELQESRDTPELGRQPKKRYVLKRLLGEGGNAEVHLARDTTLERDVAFKMLGAEQAASDDVYMKWFEREAKLGSRLNHPNVVTVFDFGTYDGRAFIAMELVEGETLRQRLAARSDYFKPEEVLRWIEETCDGLGYAHASGLVHRDIKLDNLMVDKMDRIKVLDFGLVKAATDETKTAVISGTPGYMAPELLLGNRADERTDIYALGVVAFALLTGQMPYSDPDIFAKHVTSPIPSARAIVAKLPKTADAFFKLALAKKPEDRLQTTASFATAFKAACVNGKPPRQVPITKVSR